MAIEAYIRSKAIEVSIVQVRKTGLFIMGKASFLAASPDGIVSYMLGKRTIEDGVIEVKCPYSKRDVTIAVAVDDKTFCCQRETTKFFLNEPTTIIIKYGIIMTINFH